MFQLGAVAVVIIRDGDHPVRALPHTFFPQAGVSPSPVVKIFYKTVIKRIRSGGVLGRRSAPEKPILRRAGAPKNADS
jgi:hypothetical protein